MDQRLRAKSEALASRLASLESVVVAYSGGVDSSFLAGAAHATLQEQALAVTAASPSLARRDLDSARILAAERGWNHLVVETNEVEREEYARNAPDRCYWCKDELFETLAPIASEVGASIAVGTNADDLGDFRPGQRAARERGILAPLVEVGLTKAEVRALSAAMGLPTADKPASPCLSSRFAYGVRVTPEGLRRIEEAEQIVRALGFETFRVRDHGDLARIEVPEEEIERAAALKDEFTAKLSALGFRYVTLDLTGFRSGSMNEVLPPSFRR